MCDKEKMQLQFQTSHKWNEVEGKILSWKFASVIWILKPSFWQYEGL